MFNIKAAFIFSGQGSQYSGMGKELYDNFRICKDTFDEADEALGMYISEICFDEARADQLNNTEYCQPAILTLSQACYRLLTQSGLTVKIMAGLSLGEYSALTCSGAFSFAEAVRLVRKRGRFMSEAVETGKGAMSAILGMDSAKLEKVCEDTPGYVICANYNAPGQIVIAGETGAVEMAGELALERGAKRAIRLSVSGPFHTQMLKPAAEKLEIELNNIKIYDMKTSVVSNVDAGIIKSKDDIIPTLIKQIISPVKWESSIRNIIDLGTDAFIEMGPGKTLTSFVKKTSKDVKALNIESVKTFENVLQQFA